jgi:hypothetical protein
MLPPPAGRRASAYVAHSSRRGIRDRRALARPLFGHEDVSLSATRRSCARVGPWGAVRESDVSFTIDPRRGCRPWRHLYLRVCIRGPCGVTSGKTMGAEPGGRHDARGLYRARVGRYETGLHRKLILLIFGILRQLWLRCVTIHAVEGPFLCVIFAVSFASRCASDRGSVSHYILPQRDVARDVDDRSYRTDFGGWQRLFYACRQAGRNATRDLR